MPTVSSGDGDANYKSKYVVGLPASLNRTSINFNAGHRIRHDFDKMNKKSSSSDMKSLQSKSQNKPVFEGSTTYVDHRMVMFPHKANMTSSKKRKSGSQSSGPKHNMVWFQAANDD